MTIDRAVWPWIIFAGLIALTFYFISGIFLPFIAGLFVSYAMHPTVTRLESFGVRRWLATLAMLLGFFVIVGTLLFVLIPVVIKELVLVAGSLPSYGNRILVHLEPYTELFSSILESEQIGSIQTKVSGYIGDMVTWGLGVLVRLLSSTLALATLISLIIITPVVSFYMLRDWPLLLEQVSKLVPRKQLPTVVDLAKQINNTLGAYMRGQSLVCLILAVIYSVGLSIVGLKYAVTIGIVTGFLAFIPYVGMLIGVVAGMGVAISQFDDWLPIAVTGAVFLVGNMFEGQVLSPNLVGGRVGLHPVWVIFALLAGGSMFGFAGILVALPVAAVLGVLVRFAVQRYMDSPLYAG